MMIERHTLGPTRSVCVREIQKSLEQSVKQLLEDRIAHHRVPGFRILNTHIETPHGGHVLFQGMQNHTSESIKSLEGYDIAWIEEAQSVSQRSLTLLRPTIRKPGSEIWASWNPKNATDPIDVLLRGDMPPDRSVVVQINYTDNPWFPDVLREEMEADKRRDPDKYAHVWLGGYEGRSEARVFRNWKVEAFDTPANVTLRFGADWGFAVDPTVLVRGFLDGRKLYIDYEAYRVGCEVDKTPALFDTVPHSRDYRITADSARPEVVSYMRRHGFPKIVPAIKGQGSIEDGISFLQSFDIIVHPRCENVIREMSAYSYKIDKLTDEVLPQLEDKDNHTIDALRYSLEGLRRAGIAPKAVKRDTMTPKDRYHRPVIGSEGGMYG